MLSLCRDSKISTICYLYIFHKFQKIETPTKPYQKQKFNPAVGWDNTTHHNAVGVNLLYFNNFLFRPVGRFGGLGSPPYGVTF